MTSTTDELDEVVLLGVLADVERGDFSVRMPLEWTGMAGKIADRLNNVIAANQTLGIELAKASRLVGKEGKLSQRLVLRGSDQVWSESAQSVNSLIEDLVYPKRSGSGHAIVDDAQEELATRQLQLLLDLRNCVSRSELILHYQPKVQLGTGAICGVEALVRWQHPARGVLLPGMFMAEVERSEMLAPLTQWVLNEALRQQRAWHDDGIDLTMAVNISAHSLTARSKLLASLEQTQKTWDTKPERLILELTESALIESDAPRLLTRVHDMGIGLSIDDFGTGYSYLSYLRRLPVDEIKIDRSFITRLASRGEDDDDAVIVRSTIELAHNLGLTVVAEGVEDGIALDMLGNYRCDRAQGYFLGRPCAAQELTPRLGHEVCVSGPAELAASAG